MAVSSIEVLLCLFERLFQSAGVGFLVLGERLLATGFENCCCNADVDKTQEVIIGDLLIGPDNTELKQGTASGGALPLSDPAMVHRDIVLSSGIGV